MADPPDLADGGKLFERASPPLRVAHQRDRCTKRARDL